MMNNWILALIISTVLHNTECFLRDQRKDYKRLSNQLLKNYEKLFMQIHDTTVSTSEILKEMINLPSNGQLFEEDIIMDERLRENVLNVHKRTSLKYEDVRWPNGVLVYDIHPSLEPCARSLLDKAIIEYETRTCIRFKKRKDEQDYVLYTSEEDMCSSNIGKVGGVQKIFIGNSCCVLGTVLHETMHSLGFIHEHSRHDRDDYVTVLWNNIDKKERNNFNKYSVSDTTDNDVPYNLASVMHYRNNAFTNNGKDTLKVFGEPDLKFGQRKKFSVGDVKGINKFYKCEKTSDDIYRGLYKVYSGKLAEKRKKDMKRQMAKEQLLNFMKD